jgi:hypothetical protein
LRAERDRVRRQLDEAPRDRSRELGRATTQREQAEQALAAYQQPAGHQPPGMLRWRRRGNDRPAAVPGGLAVATQQVDRAHDRERELRQHTSSAATAGWKPMPTSARSTGRSCGPWPGSGAPPE